MSEQRVKVAPLSGTILTGSMDQIKWSKVGRLVTIMGQANLSESIEAWGVKTIATLPYTSGTRVVAPVATQFTPMPLIVDISAGSTQLNIRNWSGATYSPRAVAFNFSYLAEEG